jgi:hypothetical protein
LKFQDRNILQLVAVSIAPSAFTLRFIAATICAAILTCFVAVPSHADKRVALIIGNGGYKYAPHLPNPAHDAEDVAAALNRMGFQTILEIDLNQAGMQDAAIRFAREARAADVALFYYSGHALQYDGVNYLLPVDARLQDEADLRRIVRVDEILSDLQRAKNLRILVLDSCRENPFAEDLKRSAGLTRSAIVGRGLARMQSPEGTIISYSTQAGQTAEDGTGHNSPYTSSFLRHIEDKDDIATVFRRISANVYEATKGTQIPELSLSFFGELYLNGKLQMAVQPPAESLFWDSIKESHRSADFNAYLQKFPNGLFAELARAHLARMAFDGVWSVKMVCTQASDGAKGYTLNCPVRVTEGVLEGWSGVANAYGSHRLHGQIDPDGTAYLEVSGLTGPSEYNVGRVKSGTPFLYHVRAKFVRGRGAGSRIESRPCDLTFTKED